MLFSEDNDSVLSNSCSMAPASAANEPAEVFSSVAARGDPDLSLEDMERLGTGDEHGEKRIIQEELLNQVLQALSGLPERHREIIRLRLLMDLPTETVARWLGRKPAYVRVRLHRALEALRKKVGDIDDRV